MKREDPALEGLEASRQRFAETRSAPAVMQQGQDEAHARKHVHMDENVMPKHITPSALLVGMRKQACMKSTWPQLPACRGLYCQFWP